MKSISSAMTVFLAIFLFAGALSAQQIWSSPSVSEMARKGIFYTAAKGHQCTATVPADVKTPDGQSVLAFTVSTPAGTTSTYAKQVICNYNQPMAAQEKYRLSFYYKGSCEGDVVYSPALRNAPYSGIAKKSTVTLKVTTQWQKAVMEFTVHQQFQPPFAIPRFQLGIFPDGGTFYLGPVTLEKLQ